ncbi:hypothetical protein MPSEU_000668600 [Mayamaea pseudoterrestris]|nr:hypothetical protein MPSEU_000668600 [Mayamaea pseudoterrestris]
MKPISLVGCFLLAHGAFPAAHATMISASTNNLASTAAPSAPSFYSYFIPLPETDLYEQTYKRMGSGATAGSPIMVSNVALSVSTNDTVIVWDHWEDGYEAEPFHWSDSTTTTLQDYTRVWGDGNASNGCAPSTNIACTDESDVLSAGDMIMIQQGVNLFQGTRTIQYDGGDLVRSNVPIAIARSVYPRAAGPSMAAEVEVYYTTYRWGTTFVSPVGKDASGLNGGDVSSNPLEFTALYCMAGENGTVVMLNDMLPKVLNKGETGAYTNLARGDRLKANKNVQVSVVTSSNKAVECLSLLPTETAAVVDATLLPTASQTTQSPSIPPVALPATVATQDVQRKDEPELWKVILVGRDCPDKVWSMKDFIQEELFMAFKAHVPELEYIAPGSPIDSESTGDRRYLRTSINVCPKNCNRPNFVQWCMFMGCGFRRTGYRSLQGVDVDDGVVLQSAGVNGAFNSTTPTQADLFGTAPQWTWQKSIFNTWTDYSQEEERFDAFVAQTSSTATRSITSPTPPHNYLAVVRDMNYILSSLAATLMEGNITSGVPVPACYLGAKLVGA